MSPAPARRAAERKGRLAEAAAALLLSAKGYAIVERRFRCGVGEIDLVARRGGIIVFVEVKLRADIEAGLYAIGPRARGRITAAARAWTARHPADAGRPMRFDAIVMAPWRRPRHIVGAFEDG